jgi:hypothetical protein
MREAPAGQGRNQHAGRRKHNAQAERWWCHALPGFAEFVDQFPHAQPGCDPRSKFERQTRMLRMSLAQAKLALSGAGRNSDWRGAERRGDVIDRRPLFDIKSLENRDIPWAGWTARLL